MISLPPRSASMPASPEISPGATSCPPSRGETVEDWDAPTSGTTVGRSVSIGMWNAIRRDAPIDELIQASPEEVILALRDHTCRKLGSFKIKDTDAFAAFGSKKVLTRGCDTVRDPNFAKNWIEFIQKKVRKLPAWKRKAMQGAWQESVTICAYVVNIKDAGAQRPRGLLSSLVQKSQQGSTSHDVWDFPAVRAIIEYKWSHWARFYLLIEFGLYLGWLISFCILLICYIEGDLEKELLDDDNGFGTRDRFLRFLAYLFDSLAIVFMSPFMLIEYNTITFYGIGWLQTWNVLDCAAYILQIIITTGHLTSTLIKTEENAYSTLLAVQCVVLSLKVQYFARIFSGGPSFVELFILVMKRIRWFLFFIVVTSVSVAMSFAALYKGDTDGGNTGMIELSGLDPNQFGLNETRTDFSWLPLRNDGEEGPEIVVDNFIEDSDSDFSSTMRALVTTYAVLLGKFDSSYVFNTTNRTVKGILFVFFQVSMSIIVLNLLIAAMTEAYSNVMEVSRIMYNMGKAQLMDELEISLPRKWGPKLKPYCHFIVIVKKDRMTSALSCETGNTVADAETREEILYDEVKKMREKMEEMRADYAEMKSSIEKLVQKLG